MAIIINGDLCWSVKITLFWAVYLSILILSIIFTCIPVKTEPIKWKASLHINTDSYQTMS